LKAVVLFLVVALSACSPLPKVVRVAGATTQGAEECRIFVVSHGWHTGIIVRAAELHAVLPALARRFPGETYYEIGWGDAGFYRSKRITVALALKAVFGPDNPTVVHVVAFRGDPLDYFRGSEVLALTISDAGCRSLLTYLNSSFARTDDGRIQNLGPGLYGNSEFYTGEGNYFLFNTCNTWTAKGLASSGFFKENAFKLTSGGVVNAVRKNLRGGGSEGTWQAPRRDTPARP
jgi:uncharacterized protein (TIGR02117 family)